MTMYSRIEKEDRQVEVYRSCGCIYVGDVVPENSKVTDRYLPIVFLFVNFLKKRL